MKVSTDACILGAWFAIKKDNPKNILDIGCGTGLLSLMLAQQKSGKITGIEIEKDCFEQASMNIQNSPWNDQCNIILGDIREHKFLEKFDFIISNPPFFDNQLQSPDLKKNMAKHGHHLSLSELSNSIFENLTDDGHAGILIPYFRVTESVDMFTKKGLYLYEILNIRQTEKHDFFRSVLLFSRRKKNEYLSKELTIKINSGYSTDFKQLLKDYYLHL